MTTKTNFLYATANRYASDFDSGFANTYQVFAFSSKKERDFYVKNGNQGANKILRNEIGYYLDDIKPFSGKAYWFRPTNFMTDSKFYSDMLEKGADYEIVADFCGSFKLNKKGG